MNEISLKQQNQKFSLKISDKLEKKIRVLCSKFPSTEWSGQLFYTYTGSLDKGDLAFVAEDLLFMDTGDTTTTEFYLDEGNAAAYIADHELWNCQVGLIHSHHNMATFFSGQDTSMLKQEGANRNHFLSLIVNNAGIYSAKLTSREVVEQQTICVSKGKSFNDVGYEQKEESSQTYTTVSTYDLTIIKEGVVCEDYEELMSIIEECNKRKTERKERERKERESFTHSARNTIIDSDFDLIPHTNYSKPDTQQRLEFKEDEQLLFDSDDISTTPLTDEEVVFFGNQILRLSLIPTYHKNIKEFVDNLEDLVSKRFESFVEYEIAMSMICDYIIDNEILNILDYKYPAIIVDDVLEEAKKQLVKYFRSITKEDNKCINKICNYIIS